MSDFDLTQFDGMYADAPNEDEEVPDGKYQANVESVELTRSKTTDKPMLKWKLKILGPDHAGRILWRHNMLANEENIRWLKKDLHGCGLDLAKLSDLPSRLGELLDLKLDITKRTRGDYESVYINRRLGGSDVAGAEGADIPF